MHLITIFSVRGYSVDYDGLKYIAVGQGYNHSMGISIDGINWNGRYRTNRAIGNAKVIKYENGIWICGADVSGTNTMIYSFEGTNWYDCYTSSGPPAQTINIFDNQCNGLAYNGLVWVASGKHNSATHSLAYSKMV